VGLGTHIDALHTTVHAETALCTAVIPTVALNILNAIEDASLLDVLAFPDWTALPLWHIPHRLASI
jgi:hypothetical protein